MPVMAKLTWVEQTYSVVESFVDFIWLIDWLIYCTLSDGTPGIGKEFKSYSLTDLAHLDTSNGTTAFVWAWWMWWEIPEPKEMFQHYWQFSIHVSDLFRTKSINLRGMAWYQPTKGQSAVRLFRGAHQLLVVASESRQKSIRNIEWQDGIVGIVIIIYIYLHVISGFMKFLAPIERCTRRYVWYLQAEWQIHLLLPFRSRCPPPLADKVQEPSAFAILAELIAPKPYVFLILVESLQTAIWPLGPCSVCLSLVQIIHMYHRFSNHIQTQSSLSYEYRGYPCTQIPNSP